MQSSMHAVPEGEGDAGGSNSRGSNSNRSQENRGGRSDRARGGRADNIGSRGGREASNTSGNVSEPPLPLPTSTSDGYTYISPEESGRRAEARRRAERISSSDQSGDASENRRGGAARSRNGQGRNAQPRGTSNQRGNTRRQSQPRGTSRQRGDARGQSQQELDRPASPPPSAGVEPDSPEQDESHPPPAPFVPAPGARGRISAEGVVREPTGVPESMLGPLRTAGVLRGASRIYDTFLRERPDSGAEAHTAVVNVQIREIIQIFQHEDGLIDVATLAGLGPAAQIVHDIATDTAGGTSMYATPVAFVPRGRRLVGVIREPRGVSAAVLASLRGPPGDTVQYASGRYHYFLDNNPNRHHQAHLNTANPEGTEIIQIYQYEDGLTPLETLDGAGGVARAVFDAATAELIPDGPDIAISTTSSNEPAIQSVIPVDPQATTTPSTDPAAVRSVPEQRSTALHASPDSSTGGRSRAAPQIQSGIERPPTAATNAGGGQNGQTEGDAVRPETVPNPPLFQFGVNSDSIDSNDPSRGSAGGLSRGLGSVATNNFESTPNPFAPGGILAQPVTTPSQEAVSGGTPVLPPIFQIPVIPPPISAQQPVLPSGVIVDTTRSPVRRTSADPSSSRRQSAVGSTQLQSARSTRTPSVSVAFQPSGSRSATPVVPDTDLTTQTLLQTTERELEDCRREGTVLSSERDANNARAHELSEELEECRRTRETLTSERDDQTNMVNTVRNHVAGLETRIQELGSELARQPPAPILSPTGESQYDERLTKALADLSTSQSREKTATAERDAAISSRAALLRSFDGYKNRITDLEKRLLAAQVAPRPAPRSEELTNAKKEFEALEEAYRDKDRQLASAKRDCGIVSHASLVRDLQSAAGLLTAERTLREQAQQSVAALQEAVQLADTSLTEERALRENADHSVAALQDAIQTAKSSLTAERALREQAEQSVAALRSTVQTVEQNAAERTRRIEYNECEYQPHQILGAALEKEEDAHRATNARLEDTIAELDTIRGELKNARQTVSAPTGHPPAYQVAMVDLQKDLDKALKDLQDANVRRPMSPDECNVMEHQHLEADLRDSEKKYNDYEAGVAVMAANFEARTSAVEAEVEAVVQRVELPNTCTVSGHGDLERERDHMKLERDRAQNDYDSLYDYTYMVQREGMALIDHLNLKPVNLN